MSNWSVFGFGGWDPLGSYGEGMMGQHFSRSAARYQARLNYKYAQKYALNSPTWTMQGYRNAGVNPILAAQHGALSVSDKPTNVQPPSQGSSTTGVDSLALAAAPFMPVGKQQREISKQNEIKTQSDQSKLEAQRSRDMLEVLQNTAKINALARGVYMTEDGTPIALVQKEGDTSKPWLSSPYSLMGKNGPIQDSEFARPNEWLLRKGFEQDLELGSEKYWRQTIPLISNTAKDIASIIADFLPHKKLIKLFKYISRPGASGNNAKGGSVK